MEIILKAENLYKNGILNDVSLEVIKGEMVAVMGPSGSGKSTLLYNISGMDMPDKGRVILGGKELTELSEDEKAELRLHDMGFVFQQMNMIENLNIIDNIMLPAVQAYREKKGNKSGEKALREKAVMLMEKMSVAGLENRKITEVSGGQLQRACICRSLMNNPKILFADEPTGALNKSASAEVMDTLVSLNKEGTTVFMVTHDSRMASRCGRILYLVDGSIQGELVIEKNLTAKQREDSVNEWLRKMEW
ncbi:MAG: ABC transporter ATP-binding protein [Clostridia bacterium]|nr:ABC transporter ATP-binding protein [Clostridia bacterium]